MRAAPAPMPARAPHGSPRPVARLLRAVLALPVLFAAFLPALARGGEDPVDDFRRYFREADDPATRVEAVLLLEGYESGRVVEALVPVLADAGPEVSRAAIRVLSGFQTRPPVEAMLAELPRAPFVVRVGLLRALAAGGYAGLGPGLADSLTAERWEERAAATAALAAAHEPEVAGTLAGLAEDPEPAVRCMALEGLAAVAPEAFLEAAPRALEDSSWQVRACAIAGLATVRERRSVELLLPRLDAEEGRLAQDAADALARLTGRSFGLRPEAWRRFWDTVGPDYRLPSEEELARLEARRAESDAQRYGEAPGTRFLGLATPSRRIVFVVDVSASMEQEVVDLERNGLDEPVSRIELVKRELVRTLEELRPYVEFNVLAFSTEVDPWKRSLVAASRVQRRAAVRWVERLEALGGASRRQTFRVPDNVSPAMASARMDLESGRTNTFGALMAALEAGGRGVFDRHYEVSVDTVFFLSDGMPSCGEVIAPDDILREVRESNRLRRVVIHTIAIGEFNKDFMRDLAVQNGGRFTDLGR